MRLALRVSDTARKMCGIRLTVRWPDKNGVIQTPEPQPEWAGTTSLRNRGPDAEMTQRISLEGGAEVEMFFARLAIRGYVDPSLQKDLDHEEKSGMQPIHSDGIWLMCNGEIYNYAELAEEFGLDPAGSDCSAIIPAISKYGFEKSMVDILDGEYALIFLQGNILTASRDRYGVRPLYFGIGDNLLVLGSDLASVREADNVGQIPPSAWVRYDLSVYPPRYGVGYHLDYLREPPVKSKDAERPEEIREIIIKTSVQRQTFERDHLLKLYRETLTEAVRKRLVSERDVGFYLSGGLDSTLVVAIACRLIGPENVVCFTVGLEGSPDVAAAREAATSLGIRQHHVLIYTPEEGIEVIPEVIRCLGSYDITTARASIPQYLLARRVRHETTVKVLLSGEGSDEIHGSYRYFRLAPNEMGFHLETRRVLSELHHFDNIRVDRTAGAHGLEVRIPFLDNAYVSLVASTPVEELMYREGQMEKQLLRDSFRGYLPDSLLYRSKEAFSDAVSGGVNWVTCLTAHAEKMVSDEDWQRIQKEAQSEGETTLSPPSREAAYYRSVFQSFYPKKSYLSIIPHYWMPRFQPEGSTITDPSATVLSCY